MRGLFMALFAFDFPGHGAGRDAMPARFRTFTAKTTTKTV